jgi:phosphoribosylglycinamide formyltransferase-1
MKKIVIFISGAGSLLESFAKSTKLEIIKVYANRECKGLEVAGKFGINAEIRSDFGENLAVELNKSDIEVVVLAGFLKVISAEFLNRFKGKVVNLHPSLLPKYGGVGFYGKKVLQAALDSGDLKTGITIHKVTEEVDHGPILGQFKVVIAKEETLESLIEKTRKVELEKYVEVVENL